MTARELRIPEPVERLLESRCIGTEDVYGVVHHAEATGEKFGNASTGRFLASRKSGKVTFWVEYGLADGEVVVHGAYSHRMASKWGDEGPEQATSDGGNAHRGWTCLCCGVPLEVQKIRLEYMASVFALDLPSCPRCGRALISEELATGRMAEAEQILEDK